jgi:acyl dehydratase
MLFYEDMIPGQGTGGPSLRVEREELIEFARRWDPMPFHVDDEAGKAAFGSITAPGVFVLALKQRLIHQLAEPHAVIASMGYDEVRFHAPVRPDDTLRLQFDYIDRRESRSKPDRGVVTVRLSLVNQAGITAMSHLDTILVRRKPPASAPDLQEGE